MKLRFSVLILLCFVLIAYEVGAMASQKLLSVEFEVFGRVQGVFFRKYTQKQGKELGLRGWCMNTPKGTVVGQLEGEAEQVEKMKFWLQKTGSPKSRIDKVEFRDQKAVPDFIFMDFSVRH